MEKKLDLWQVILLGLAYMAPALSLLATFRIIMAAGYTWTAVPLAYLIAGVAIIITAVAFANLSKLTPKGGSVWTYAKDALGPKFGQFAVWIYLLQLVVVPAAAMIPVGIFAQSWLGISPWITVLIGFLFILGIALLGIDLSFKTMAVLFIGELIILVTFAVSSILWSSEVGAFGTISRIAITPSGSLFGIAGIIVGAAAAVYSFLGYESSATMAEEVKSPMKNIPKAIVITSILGTILLVFLAWSFVVSIPAKGLFSLIHYFNPIPAMAGVVWGDVPPFYYGWRHILSIGGIAAGVTAALAGLLASSRVIKKLGEEKIIPSHFNKVSKKRGAPVAAILLVGSIGLFLGQFAPWESIVYAIATGAVPTIIIVNFLSFWRYRNSKVTPSTIITQKILPVIGIAMGLWILFAGLPTRMLMVLMVWVVLGILLVFVNNYLKPSIFSNKNNVSKEKLSPSRWGLVASSLALILVVIIFAVWYKYYAGSLAWWNVIAPYASGNLLASVVAIGAIVVFIVGMVKSNRFTSEAEQKTGGVV